jgi:hypothetical protein
VLFDIAVAIAMAADIGIHIGVHIGIHIGIHIAFAHYANFVIFLFCFHKHGFFGKFTLASVRYFFQC